MTWRVSSSADPEALAIVDGTGKWSGFGPHYSRRTPGSRSFTGVGREVVLVSQDGTAVWAVVYQRTPTARGQTVQSRPTPFVWRNMLFRNLGAQLSSWLILEAVRMTYKQWAIKYGQLPEATLRTEIDPRCIRGNNPGCCYKHAGFHNPRLVRGKLHFDAPCPLLLTTGKCECCVGSIFHKEKGKVLLSYYSGPWWPKIYSRS